MIKALIKNRLNSVFGSIIGKRRDGSVKKASVGKIIALSLILLLALGSFLVMFVGMAIALGYVLIPIGASWLYFSVFMLLALSVIFILSIFETKSELFECKDNDLLLSMPIKPRDIVIARISVVLIYNYIEAMAIMLPCTVVYGIVSRDILGVIGSLIVLVLIPIISTALSCGAGYGVALLSKKLRKNSFVTVAISILIMAVYFVGYEVIVSNMSEFLKQTEAVGSVPEMPFLYYIGSAALLKPISIFIMIFLTALLAFSAYTVISSSYIKLVTDVGGVKRGVYKNETLKARGTLSALVCKELKGFASSATYMLNSGIGLVFMLVIAVVALVNSPVLLQIADLLYTSSYVDTALAASPVIIAAAVLLSSFNSMSACALSLEGKNLWIIKTMPITDRELLLSKILPQIIITTPPTLVCSVLFMIALPAPLELWVFFILTPVIANIFFAVFGMIMNVAFPKFDFENEAQPIKQSMSVFITLVAQMLLSTAVGIAALLLVFVIPPVAVAALTLALYALLSVVSWLVLMGPLKRKYSKINL